MEARADDKLTGHRAPARFHFYGKRVYQDLWITLAETCESLYRARRPQAGSVCYQCLFWSAMIRPPVVLQHPPHSLWAVSRLEQS